MKRRSFVAHAALAVSGGAAIADARGAELNADTKPGEIPLIVSTWPFGKPANEAALKALIGGGAILDAVEQGIRVTELGEGNPSVGLGGLPNAAGVVQLDACIMSGPGHQAGSVAAIEGIRHPISAARRVMEKTRHVMLVGECARMFAIDEGLESIEVKSAEQHEAWRKKREWSNREPKEAKEKSKNHDTIALLVLGIDGNIAGGCSTSGLSGKLPGRVGDSPIVGSGLYVDNEVGAAGATGIGENVMRYCGSFLVVEYMRQGLHPQEACLETIRRIARKNPKGTDLKINFVALDKKGRYGAAGSGEGFKYAVTTRASSGVHVAPGVGKLDVGPEGGNRK
ncbi:MAG: N(4)-(beta-N-acetylglucosaminyl)-L-asparaginase [Verrucomicrobiales bacterium]